MEKEVPLAVGFGISTPEHVEHVSRIADGVIVGSVLIDTLHSGATPARRRGRLPYADRADEGGRAVGRAAELCSQDGVKTSVTHEEITALIQTPRSAFARRGTDFTNSRRPIKDGSSSLSKL